jgi:predicted Zn-dependent protease
MMMRRLLIVLILSLQVVGAADKKAPKPPKQRELKPGFTMFGVAQDVEMGKQAVKEIEPTITILNDAAMTAYVKRLGDSLTSKIKNPPFPFTYKVVNDPQLNAFCVPGGFVYVNTGILMNAENEAQVVGVMGHEIGHAILRHSANQMSKGMLLQGLATAGAMYGEMKGGVAGMAAQLGGGLGAQMMMMKFSRNHEKDSDAYGARLMSQAGYNPIELARFFEKMQQLAGGKQAGGVAGWMSSHPDPGSRSQLIEQEILAMPRATYNGDTGEFARFKAAAAKVVPAPPKVLPGQGGPAPDSTTVKGFSVFKAQSFEISYPKGWTAQGSPEGDAATLAPAEGLKQSGQNVAIGYGIVAARYKAASGKGDLKRDTDALIQETIKGNSGMKQTQPPVSRTIDGQPALLTGLTSPSALENGNEIDMLVTVQRPDGLLYFVMIAPESKWRNAEPIFDQVIGSIRIAR